MALKPVNEWGIGDATAAAAGELPRDYQAVRGLIEDGNHWQDGTLWPGHRTGDPVTDAAIRANVEPQFIADDVSGEMVENRTNGLLGQEADVTLVPLHEGEPTEAEAREIEQIMGAIAAWWDGKRLWEKVGAALGRVSYAGRATVRPFIAEGNLTTSPGVNRQPARTTLPNGKNLADALDLIDLDTPLPDLAVRYTDPRTQRPAAVVVTETDGQRAAEVWTVNQATGKTELRLLGSKERGPGPVLALDLKKHLPLAEVRGNRIITPSVVKLQSLLNFIMTVTGRTVETAGFRERYLKNVEPPGMWLPTAPVNSPPLAIDESGPAKLYKHRVPWVLGAAITNELVGIRTTEQSADGTSREVFGSPDVQALDPVDPAYATDAADTVSQRLYKRGKQGHLGLAKTGETSGTAYQQARAQFEADLKGLKGPAEGMLRDLLEVVLAYAGLMSTEAAGLLDRYRVQVTLHVSAGPITAEDASAAVALRDKRAISQQTMLARVGIEDPDAEQGAIDADPLQAAAFWTAMAPAWTQLTAITTPEAAAILLHLSTEQVALLLTAQEEPGAAGAPQLVTAA
ncbi:MAG TPA: hypothetical protein VGP44_12810 [Gemmatimonadales bacterium]|nr:hypothetical protein [Gemmatimonadales bacterium]